LRQMVLLRDNYTCQKCGSEVSLHCHHIWPLNESPITSADMDECITLCKSCHKEIHMNVAGCGYYEMRCSIK
jgi:5-methylcytosine-specific restriction endonuclease McrA